MTNSCSFRITRTAEDLAQTITALSQRLVKLEQRQEALELVFKELSKEPSEEEKKMLDGVETLMKECQELLQSSSNIEQSDECWSEEHDGDQDIMAA